MKLFISKLHYETNPCFYKRVLVFLLSIGSIPYGIITSVRNFLYDKNIIKSYFPNVKTIAVGNLTTGGVGKTPFTAALAEYCISRGKKVAIVSRGYGGELPNKEVNVVSDGEKIFFSAKEAGDEPVWLAEHCPSAVVLTCSSRSKAAMKAEKDFGCDVIIADDAFQHRKLNRNDNFVLIDQANKFGNEKLLPAGPLRECLKNIKRATAVIVTNKTLDDENALKYCDEVKQRFNKPTFLCKMLPEKAYNIQTNEKLYKGAAVMAFCAIGQPKEFFDFVKKDYQMLLCMEFPDHHPYSVEDAELLLDIAQKNDVKYLITTEKDAVKVKDIFCKFKTDIKVCALPLKACVDLKKIISF